MKFSAKLLEDLEKITCGRRTYQSVGMDVRCAKHPTYRGIREPRVKCGPCFVVRATSGRG